MSGKPIRRHASDGRGLVRVSPATADVLDNPESVKDWDDEELRRGRRRDRNGSWTGRDPIVVPTVVYQEMVRRAVRKAEGLLTQNLTAAVKALIEIAQDKRAEDKDRVKAASIIMDRVMGRAPEVIEMNNKAPLFLSILQGGIVSGGTPMMTGDDDEILDGEVVFDSDEFVEAG